MGPSSGRSLRREEGAPPGAPADRAAPPLHGGARRGRTGRAWPAPRPKVDSGNPPSLPLGLRATAEPRAGTRAAAPGSPALPGAGPPAPGADHDEVGARHRYAE